MESMKVEIHSTNLIKPSVPTPPTLRHHKIGFIDEFAPVMNIPLVLFFSVSHSNLVSVSKLEKSLEKTLTQFYPLAGRYVKDMHTVDCSDQGAVFLQARANITLEEILEPHVKPTLVNAFIPSQVGAVDEVTDAILAAQVTMFQCGGMALGVSLAHRIVDASTLSAFINHWAALSRNETEVELVGPGFNTASLFPARGLPPLEMGHPRLMTDDVLNKFVIKKLCFSETAISNMKAKAIVNGKASNFRRSKVQLVSSIIWKAFMGVDRAIRGYPRASVLIQSINLREKTASLIPKNSYGNLWGLLLTECGTSESLMEFEGLADILTDSVKKAVNDYSKIRHDSDEGQMMVLNSLTQIGNISDMVNVVALSSWCKFPFYEANFGFGRPVWISCGGIPSSRAVFMLDDAGGNGVEAYVSMVAEEVPYFQQDPDIKAFAG